MKKEIQGWIVLSTSHPNKTDKTHVDWESFEVKRSDSIKAFTKGTGEDWEYWKSKYGFKCVKASLTIQIQKTK